MGFDKEIKALKLLKDRGEDVGQKQRKIAFDLADIKDQLKALEGGEDVTHTQEYARLKERYLKEMTKATPLTSYSLEHIYDEAQRKYPGRVSLADILDESDRQSVDDRLQKKIDDFNHAFSLDRWDYAIAGCCGLFAAMLDILCIGSSMVASVEPVGKRIFSKEVREAFERNFSPSLGEDICGCENTEDGGHTQDVGVILKTFESAFRLRDGFSSEQLQKQLYSAGSQEAANKIIATILSSIVSRGSQDTVEKAQDSAIPQPLIELLSKVMRVVREDKNTSDLLDQFSQNTQVLRSLIKGDPRNTMESFIQAFWIIKEAYRSNGSLADTQKKLMIKGIQHRIQMMYAIAYGCFTAINAMKETLTSDCLTVNYAVWERFVWHGFYALKWVLLDRKLALWNGIEDSEIERIKSIIDDIDNLQEKVSHLPT